MRDPFKTCATCEYFDGGGLLPNGQWKEQRGDCLNRLSGLFQTNADGYCPYHFRDEVLSRSGTVTNKELASIKAELEPPR